MGYRFSSDYDSLIAVIRNLTDEEKKKIVQKVQELVGSTSIEALTHFIGAQVNLQFSYGLLFYCCFCLDGFFSLLVLGGDGEWG